MVRHAEGKSASCNTCSFMGYTAQLKDNHLSLSCRSLGLQGISRSPARGAVSSFDVAKVEVGPACNAKCLQLGSSYPLIKRNSP